MSKNHIDIIALLTSAVLLLLLFVSYWCKPYPEAALIVAIVIVLFEVVMPLEIIKFYHLRSRDFNLYAHNLETTLDLLFPPFFKRKIHPDFRSLAMEFVNFLFFSGLILVPYSLCYFGFYKLLALKDGLELHFSFNLPPKFFYEIMTQIFVVALPEEIFYRGFLQSALLKRWHNHKFLFGLPVGRAIIVVNIIFALGHVASSLAPVRLLTFFPGLLFSYLVYKNKSLFSAILFHALCNIAGQILFASIYTKCL